MEQEIRLEFLEIVRHLCQRPSMWVRPPNFDSVCTFISGYNFGRDGGPLAGFREWLIVRADGGNNLTWDGLVMLLLVPVLDWSRPLTADQDTHCLQGMAELFEEFLGFRQEHGITKIHCDYGRWLHRQDWYTGSLLEERQDSD